MKTILIGAQFGDEGKGKMADILAKNHDIVARYQGGANAGHTVYRNGEKYVFHMIPSGILYPNKICIVGNGCVVDLEGLGKEIQGLEKSGVEFGGRFKISDRATMILPYHKAAESGEMRLGTTKRGIGPAYTSRRNRTAVTVGDAYEAIQYENTRARFKETIESDMKLHQIQGDPVEVLNHVMQMTLPMADFIEDTQSLLHQLDSNKLDILVEGAQGTFLDVDHGTYPFVTSSNTTIGGAYSGTGLPPRHDDVILGIAKAYITRVGSGPLPTEQCNSYGQTMQREGNEVGATTGRSRRCGWFDVPLAKKASEINGFHGIALMKIDVLDSFPEVPVCTSYTFDGDESRVPSTMHEFENVQPVYTTLQGWQKKTSGETEWKHLPDNARRYVDFLEKEIDVPITYVSTGPGENDIITM